MSRIHVFAEIVTCDGGLDGAKVLKFSTPGAQEDLHKASTHKGVTCFETSNVCEVLRVAAAIFYREIIARLNYCAQDRMDSQYACQEASRRMSKPRVIDWPPFRRIERYLVCAPRYIQKFDWQEMPDVLDVFMDSDWAGCKSTCRSTSGGVVMFGKHCMKSWSSTQAAIT